MVNWLQTITNITKNSSHTVEYSLLSNPGIHKTFLLQNLPILITKVSLVLFLYSVVQCMASTYNLVISLFSSCATSILFYCHTNTMYILYSYSSSSTVLPFLFLLVLFFSSYFVLFIYSYKIIHAHHTCKHMYTLNLSTTYY